MSVCSWDYTEDHTDCNDHDRTVNPGAREVCDYQDNNCDGQNNEAGAKDCIIYYKDIDHDGWGITDDSRCLCDQDANEKYTALQSGDPDDTNDRITGASTTINMVLHAGWNMISLPVLSPSLTVQDLFPGTRAIFGFGHKYHLIDPQGELEMKKGYWIYVEQETVYPYNDICFALP